MSKVDTHVPVVNTNPQLGEQALHVPLDDIYVDYGWNTRSERRLQDMADTESAGFEGFGASIRQQGQITPVILRNTGGKTINGAKTDKKYELIVGFRRTRAVTLLNNKGELDRAKAENKTSVIPNVPNGHISAIVRDINNKTQARLLNGLENTGRSQLKAPDMCFLAMELAKEGLTQVAIAEALGVNQPWVSKLLTIASLPPVVLSNWRDGKPIPAVITKEGKFELTEEDTKHQKEMTQPDMFSLAGLKCGPEDITARYIRHVLPTASQGEGPGTGDVEKDKIAEEIRATAAMMACMVKAGVLENGTLDWGRVIGPRKDGFPMECGKDRSQKRLLQLADIAGEAFDSEISKVPDKGQKAS